MENKEIIKNLKSSDTKLIIESLKYISKKGNKDVLTHAIDLVNSSSDKDILNEVINIIENLKEQNCAEVIVNAIRNNKNENSLQILVSSCWKNGLNYQDYIETFVDIFIKSNFLLAFEAFTVIDTFEKVDISNADLCLIKLNNAIEDSKEDKKQLFYELIKIVEDLKENPA